MGTRTKAAVVIGYDPGGNGRHGLAVLGKEGQLAVQTLSTVKAVVAEIESVAADHRIDAVGIDALTVWNTGRSGGRPADHFLREECSRALVPGNSVVMPNSLYSAMSLNGAMVVLAIEADHPHCLITESHPKIHGRLHSSKSRGEEVRVSWVREEQKRSPIPGLENADIEELNDHELDALICAIAGYRAKTNAWTLDLHHNRPIQERYRDRCGEAIKPFKNAHFYWPGVSGAD